VPVPGHINPTLPVARALVHRGHRVRYFTSVALAGRVAASGAEPVVYGPAVGPEVMRPPRSLTALARETDALGAALLPDVLRTLRADPPDLVAYDSMCTWGHTAARAFPAMCWTATVALHASFRTAVFTSRAFQPGADLFDGEVAWVGYPPAELSTVSPRRHTYAALGTLFNERPEVFRAIAEPIDGEVLMAVGRADLGALGPLPERVRAVPWVDDQAVVLRQLWDEHPTPERIRAAAVAVLDSDAAERAARLGRTLAEPGPGAAADAVEAAASRA